MAIDLSSFSNFMQSPGGAAAINAVGGGVSAYGQYQQNQQNQKQNAQQFAANAAQTDYWNRQNQNSQRAAGVLGADPLGADQSYAQKQALMAAILPQLRNAHSTPGDPNIAAAMGSHTGGFRIPEGGFDPMMVAGLYGNNATMGAITQRHKELSNLDPNAPTADLGSMYGDEAKPYIAQMSQWAQAAQAGDANERANYEQKINALIQENLKKEQGSGFWHKFAKIAGVVGAVAATVMTAGGASPLLVGAIGAGAGAASSWGGGGNPLTGAIIGGASGYGGAKLGGDNTLAKFGHNPQTSIIK